MIKDSLHHTVPKQIELTSKVKPLMKVKPRLKGYHSQFLREQFSNTIFEDMQKMMKLSQIIEVVSSYKGDFK